MPGRNTTLPAGSKHTGWYRDGVNNVLEWYNNGTKIAQASSAAVTYSDQLAVANGFNIRVGTISAFATTQPTNWIVFRAGTQPSGAITTAGGIGADATTMQKIIAAGTINNIET